jgi:replicative DNA helicase
VAQPQPNKYSFDGEFVTKLVALLVRDPRFAESTQGLIKASYMQSDVDAFLVDIILRYFERYRATPSSGVVMQELHKAINSGNHRPEFLREVVLRFQSLQHADISDGQYVIDNVTEFAKQTEMRQAILEASLMVQVGDFAGIEKRVREALMVGSSESRNYDLMVEAENRSERRRQVLAGHIQPVGITTGIMEIDQRLKHKGFGRGELSVWMGAAKSGKSQALLHSAAAAILGNKNVLFVSLENSLEVTTDRFDAHITGIPVNMLEHQANDVERKLLQHRQNNRLGKLHIEEFPIGTWRPMDADRLIQRYKANGVIFDELVVDYLDIMRPNHKSKDPIEDSKSVWMDMRAIAQREHVAIVTATQTNRGGFKAVVADATHVADDINKIRIADLVISINRDENDRAANEAKLHMAAGRNQEDGITFRVSQDLARAKFVVQVLGLC